MADDTMLIRAVAAVAGMQPGQIARKPAARARQLVADGYAHEVESLDDRLATEPPNRHRDRNPIPPAAWPGLTPPAEWPGPITRPAAFDDGVWDPNAIVSVDEA